MKRIAIMLLAIALAAMLGAAALAEGWTEYVNKDGAKVYADYDTDSKVIAMVLPTNEEIMIARDTLEVAGL